jgi:hypothetical protein
VARLDAELPVTREELEATLEREGFVQQGSVWWSQDRTKFVCFPDDTSGEAIYGDSEIGEPGKTVPISVAGRVVRGEFLLDSPLGVMPAQQRDPAVLAAPRAVRALGWSDAQVDQELAPWSEEKSPRGLTADDPLPALPAHANMKKRVHFVRPGSSDRHETLRPPPSDRPAEAVMPTTPTFKNLDEPTQEWTRFHRVTMKLRWAAVAAALLFFVGIFLPHEPRTFLIYFSSAASIVIFGTIITLLTLARRSRKKSA